MPHNISPPPPDNMEEIPYHDMSMPHNSRGMGSGNPNNNMQQQHQQQQQGMNMGGQGVPGNNPGMLPGQHHQGAGAAIPFQPPGSRRVSVGSTGGMGNMGGPGSGAQPLGPNSAAVGNNRRTSLSNPGIPLDDSIQALFGGRRGSGMSFTGGMGDDSFYDINRRGSLDTTTAVLDSCILELTRRRISMGMARGDLGLPPTTQSGVVNPANPSMNPSQSLGGPQSIAARQQQLQQQQMELDNKKKELEFQQRQQFLGGMSDQGMPQGGESMGSQTQGGMGGAGGMGQFFNNSMGSNRMPSFPTAASLGGGSGAGGQDAGGPPQWWICQVCNTKAFASRDEAMEHEAICPARSQKMDAGRQVVQQMPNFGGMGVGAHQQHQLDPTDQHGSAAAGGFAVSNDGQFTTLQHPLALAMQSDGDWLTPLHCFVRRSCVEVFCASTEDVATPSKGKRKPIQVGQVGIRCPHCHSDGSGAGQRERGSVYYPTTISSIYNATMNLLQRHLHSCQMVPKEVMQQYQTLKADDARSGTSKKYWIESALSLGLVDTPSGIRFSSKRPPPLPRLSRHQVQHVPRHNNMDDFDSKPFAHQSLPTMQHPSGRFDADFSDAGRMAAAGMGGRSREKDLALVSEEDRPYATAFSFYLMSQMQPCVFTEADRLGKRKGLPAGFAGLACRHCFGGYGSGRFFPSSIKTLSDTSKTLNVLHNHMSRCRKCPPDVSENLEKLRVHHDDERAKMKFGSQKAFFAKIWARLHDSKDAGPTKRSLSQAFAAAPPPANVPPQMMGGQQMGGQQMGGQPFPQFHTQQQQQHAQQQQQQQQQHQMPPNGYAGGLDVLSQQAENDIKRQRIGL